MARIEYNAVAKDYDRARAMPLADIAAWRDAVAPYVSEPLVDVGSGTGLFAFAFAEWFDVPVFAIEPSAAMLEKARTTRSHSRISYLEGDGARVPLPDGSVGLAWLSTVIHHIPDLTLCARELRRVLQARGRVLIRSAFPGRLDDITLFRYFPTGRALLDTYPSLEQTIAAFGTAGFGCEAVRSVPQVSAPNLAAFLEAVRLRADTVLRGIPDDEFAAGITRLENAVLQDENYAPIVDRLDLVVLR